MATLIVDPAYSFDINAIDYSWYLTNEINSSLQNVSTSFNGVTYQSYAIVIASSAPIDHKLDFFGTGLTGTNSPISLTGGTVQAIAEIDDNNNNGTIMWSFAGLSLSASALFAAMQTISNSDELALLATALSGDDIITLSDQADNMNGYDGNDILDGRAGGDTLNGGNGFDTATFHSATSSIVLDLATPSNNTGDAAGDTFTGIEKFIGSDFNDTITGSSSGEYIDGGLGADAINAGGGNDHVYWDAADTSVQGGAGNDVLIVAESDALPTGFNLISNGFEAAQQTIHDSGANSWDSVARTYNGLWHLVQRNITNDDGTRSLVNLDPENVSATNEVWFAYDNQDRLSSQDLYYDNGTRTFINVDEDGSKSWTQDWFAYDSQGHLSSEDVLYDDGSRTFINLDEDGSKSWTQDWFAYDNQGRLSSEDVFYDDGTRTYINLDENNSQSWDQAWFTYDNQGRLDTQDVIYDDGSRIFYNYDQDSTQPFILTAFLYDNTGHAYQQIIQWDNGSTSYINL